MTIAPRAVPVFEEPLETLESAGVGALFAAGSNLPLAKLDVRARVQGLACETEITQVFRNPHREFVEATYIFPLPGRFAVTACQMRVGDRLIEADLKERSQARADYRAAIRAGQRASIAEEERSETFNLRVGNIPPGEEVAIRLTLVGTISVAGGEGTLRIPLVVAPRYAPGLPLDGAAVGGGTALDTDEVPDASRVTPPTLLPGFPNPVALSVEVELNPGQRTAPAYWRAGIRSSLHSVFVSETEPVKIRLLPGERANRDFILRFPVLSSTAQLALEFSCLDGQRAGTFALTVLPPAAQPHHARPRDVVFVLDRSGSMEGWKMVAARRALARMVDSLLSGDRFRMLAFDDHVEWPAGGADWQPATDRLRWQAAEWIARIESRGGTELGRALRDAMQALAAGGMPEGRDAIVVLITDGQVAGEDSVLRTIQQMRLPSMPRIFTLGIDRAVNASLLTRLAELGGGAFELVESEERLDQVMERFHRDIASPVLTDVKIEPLDFDLVAGSVTPGRPCAVFADRPLTLYGRLVGRPGNIRLRVTARDAGGAPWQQDVTARISDSPALLPLWGRGRVRELEDQYARGEQAGTALEKEIVKASLESHVLSRFTAYVAVDRAEIVNPEGVQHQIVQPVEAPEGWDMLSRGRSLRRKQLGAAYAVPPGTPLAGDGRAQADKLELESLACELLPESVARENNVVPVREEAGRLVVRMSDPNDLDKLEKLRFILGRPVDAEAARLSEIHEEINEKYALGEGESADSTLQEFTDTAIEFFDTAIDFTETEAAPGAEEVTADSPPIVRLVQLIVAEAIQLRATHAYLRPADDCVQISYIIDGEPKRRDSPPSRLLLPIVNRLRVLAKIPVDTDGLQMGEFKIALADVEHMIRLHIIPTPRGPAVVLRLVDWPTDPQRTAWRAVAGEWLRHAQAACGSDPQAAPALGNLRADSA